uniref:Mediator of RNA polymerase II transcription subunit 29 n=1 Tax=Pipistrellus kuhlii TaxID=59472 RepID=A0A7J7SPH1_PIPKU|nr:mediator complex subunit 29 [Pipistrellus kuhlii]
MAASQPQGPAASASGVSGPGSAGGLGTQQQPQPPSQLVGSAQGGLLQQQQQDFDPVQRYKMLIPQLKESLQTLMKVAAQNLIQNTNIDNGQKSSDGPIQRFDKCLEEFYALCDQLELCLYLAVIKAQIACAKDIHTALLDCANKVTGKTSAPPTGSGSAL